MKCFLIMLLLSCTAMLFAQPTFQIRYHLQNRAGRGQLLQFPQGGSVVIGNSATGCDQYNRNCFFSLNANRISGDGKLLWHKKYSTGYNYVTYQTKSLVTKNGGFAFFESLVDTATGSYHGGLLVRCNAAGAVVWSKQVTSARFPHFEPFVLAEDNDGNLLLFYTVSKNSYASSLLQIVKVSGTGNLLWYKTTNMTDAGYVYYEANSFAQIDNRYIIAGDLNNQIFEGLLSSNVLVLDTSGTIVRYKQIDIAGLPQRLYNTMAIHVFAGQQKLYVLGSYFDNEPEIGSRYYVLPLSGETKTATGFLFSNSDFALQRFFRSHKAALPFSRYYTSFNKNGSLAQLSLDASYTYLKQYDTLGRICPDYTTPVVDSGLIEKTFTIKNITGYHGVKDSVYLTDKIVTVSADAITYEVVCSGSAALNSISEERKTTAYAQDKRVQVYPNPARNTIYIAGLQGKATITVFSATGSMLKAVAVVPSNTAISISDLSSGVYFMRICEPAKTPYIVTFIKE